MRRNPVLYKSLVVGVILLLLCMSFTPSVAIDNVKKSSIPISSGNILYVGGFGPGNYTKIKDAIKNASDGDTVFVYDDSSPYYEFVGVYKSINLIGEDRYSTIIDGSNSDDVIYVTADWVNITGFTIRNSGDVPGDSGIEIFASNCTIKHNIIINNRLGVNFRFDPHYNNRVLNNTITSNSESGIFAWPYPVPCKNLTIIGNEITYNEYSGIALMAYCKFSTISYNTISYNNNEGINMQSKCNDSLISNNKITNNVYYGFWLVFSYRCTVRDNYFEKNGWELSIYENEESNEPSNHSVYHNTFIDGSNNECEDDGTSNWDNGYPSGGNYWNSYEGVDLFSGPNQDIPGSDGIGDTPYPIPIGDNEDKYPLMEPYSDTELSIDFKKGFLNFSGDIENTKDKTAFNVQYEIKVEGGFVLRGRNSHEIIPVPLLPGEKTTISPDKIFGFGRIIVTIEVWADNAPLVSLSKPGFLFLWFIFLKL